MHNKKSCQRQKNILYFLNPIYKVSAQETIIRLMQERMEATRPQLADAAGLSLVTVNKAVASLCLQGVLRLKGTVPSGGGRPVQLYAYNAAHAVCAIFRAEAEQGFLHGILEIADMSGRVVQRQEARFSLLQEASLDDWLDAATRRKRLHRVVLDLPSDLPETGLAAHLRARYACSVRRANAATGLISAREETLALYLPPHLPPQGCLRRNGTLTPCDTLHLLPLPTAWETLDYDDHTLTEEMVSRLLHLLTATHAPARFELFADFWTERLQTRIRYNLSAKLRGFDRVPRLHFRPCTPAQAHEAVRRSCIAAGDSLTA